MVRLDIVDADVERFVDGRSAARGTRVHQIARHFGLAIDHDRFAGERFEIDAMPRAVKGNSRSVVNEPLATHASSSADFFDQRDGALLEHPGANAAEHIGLRFLLENECVDPGVCEQLPKQKAGWARADDDDLTTHVTPGIRCKRLFN